MTTEVSESHIQARIKSGRIVLFKSDNVYDLTDFADRHPGGKEYLEEKNGQDVSELMQRDVPHKHSTAAYSMMKKYCIGKRQKLNSKNGTRHRTSNKKSSEDYSEQSETDLIQMTEPGNIFLRQLAKHSHKPDGKDGLIDWSKPIIWQVPSLGDKYFDWVHVPVDTHMRLFEWDFVEYFSQCSWYIIPIFWIPVMLCLMYMSFISMSAEPVSWPQNSNYSITLDGSASPFLYLFGVLLWTFEEYVIHRWLFHMKPPANFPSLIWFHFLLHGQHHKTPMDRKRLVFPPIPAICLGVIVYSLYCCFLPSAAALMVFSGSICGYLFYDMIHYYLHHGGVPFTDYFRSLKKYHVCHHFENQQKGFGISSKLWDYPFKTLIEH